MARAVLEEAGRQGLELVRLDDALAAPRRRARAARAAASTTWGTPRDLSTWDGPAVADLAFARPRRRAAGRRRRRRRARATAAVRELLALQSSDWAFLVTRDLAGAYRRERARATAGRSTRRWRSLGSADGAAQSGARTADAAPPGSP